MLGNEEHRKVRLRRRKSHARFDEGGMVETVMVRIVRHRRTKGAETDRPNLKPQIPSLYSTLYSPRLMTFEIETLPVLINK